MSTTPTDYGEPWRYCIEDHPFVVNCRDELVIAKTDESMGDMDIHRAIACTNTLAGIPDPEAAIQAAREALEQVDQHLRKMHGAIEKFQDAGYMDQNPLKLEINFRTCRQLLKALALLTPTPTKQP